MIEHSKIIIWIDLCPLDDFQMTTSRPNEPTTGTPLSWTPHEIAVSMMPFQCASQILTQAAVRFRTHCGCKGRHGGCGTRQARQEQTATTWDEAMEGQQRRAAVDLLQDTFTVHAAAIEDRVIVWPRASHLFARSAPTSLIASY